MSQLRHIHLIGICGTAMASLAGMLKQRGFHVTGSDAAAYPPMSDFLASLGIPVAQPFSADNLEPRPDLVIVGNAISRGNAELEYVLDQRIKFQSLPQILHDEFLSGRNVITIAGTHGKTTTTSMTSWIFDVAGREPSFLIGGIAENFQSSFRVSDGENFVIEGDEYDTAFWDKGPKFLHYFPDSVILTSVEFDHADIYKDLDAVKIAFRRLVNLVPRRGKIVAWDGSRNVDACLAKAFCPVEHYGFSEKSQWRIMDVKYEPSRTTWRVSRNGAAWAQFEFALAGEYNVLNATAAAAMAANYGISVEHISEALKTFQSVKRRLEVRAEVNGVTIIDDFAHHPTAIAETLKALRTRYAGRRLWAVLEPRSNTLRRNVFEHELVRALGHADQIVMAAIFKPEAVPLHERLDPVNVIRGLQAHNKPARLLATADEIVENIAPELKPGDVVGILSNGGFGGIYGEASGTNPITQRGKRVRTMKRIAAAILLCSSTVAFAQAPCPAPTNSGAVASSNWLYNIQAADLRRQMLRVRMTIAPTSADLRVQLPVWNAVYQVRDFAEHVNWLRATDAEGKAVAVRKIDKTTWSAPNATTVEYEIAAIDAGPFGAELTTEHLFLNLAQVLVYPVGVPKQLVRVELSGLPSAWKTASPMNREANGFCAESYDRMADSPIEASEFKVIAFELQGAKYSAIVDADANDYDEAAIKNMLRKVVAAETDWMQDRPFDRYTFLYHFTKEYGRGGMEHAYATAIESSATRLQQEPLALASVSAHEFFHLWNVKRIRSQALEPINYTKENYTRTLWFSEGFTNTVGDYMLVRAGLANEQIFLDRLAAQIKTLETRSAHLTQSAEESSLDAWLEKYPYYRAPERSVSYYDVGQIIGVLLDLEMRRVTDGKKSLRDLFQYMNAEYAKKGKFFDDENGVRAAAETVTGKNLQEFFRRTTASTEPLPYDQFETVGLKLERVPSKASDAGFTAAMNFGPTPVVIATTPGGEAEKAGLKTGDTILFVNGREPSGNVVEQIAAMDPGSTVKLKVRSRSGTREVKYKLAQKSDVDYTFSELPDASVAQKARRAAWIRGDSEVH